MKFLRAFQARKQSPLPPTVVLPLHVDGDDVLITYRRHATARRFTLRATRDGTGFVMTMPKRANLDDAQEFAARSLGWIRTSRQTQHRKVTIAEGAEIMLRGVAYRIVATGKLRGQVTEDGDARLLHVPGGAAHMPRRLTDWLKAEAAHELDVASHKYATAMLTHFRRITVRDQKSRWGSCSSDGVLSYSWRLILAPPLVLDYVAAHEVAHLCEMNHGAGFWRLVLKHCPAARDARRWLKLHGASLHSLG